MQEEVSNRSINLAVSTTKLTARSLIRALRWYLMHRNQKRLRKSMEQANGEGKQTVADLIKSGVGTDKIELPDGSAKDFCKLAKKFGVDYAIRKDKTMDPPRYVVFFKAKDTEVLDQVIKEYTARTLEKKEKESVREQLKAEKAKDKAEKKEQIKAERTESKAQKKAAKAEKAKKHRKVRTEGR